MFSSVLNRLANRHGSDKGSTVADRHRYAQLYDVLFHNEREGTRKVLELGLARGGPEAPIGGAVERHCGSPSVAMWIEYFPNAAIYGFDISDFAHLEAIAAVPPIFRALQRWSAMTSISSSMMRPMHLSTSRWPCASCSAACAAEVSM